MTSFIQPESTSSISVSSAIKQASSSQDFTCHGTSSNSLFTYLVVADGHGYSPTIDYLRNIPWSTFLETDNFMEKIIEDTSKLYPLKGGSTLSIAIIYLENKDSPNRVDCYWIGDSSIKVYENENLIFKSKDHDRDNKEEIKRVSECCNMRGIQREGVWDIKVIDDKNIVSIPSAIFDFGEGGRINFTHSLGHGGKTGNHYAHETIMLDSEKTYKTVLGSDGFWMMTHDGDIDTIANKDVDSEALVTLAHKRWNQEWVHDNTQEKIAGMKFPRGNIDDICVASALIKLLSL